MLVAATPAPAVVPKPSGPKVPISTTTAMENGFAMPAGKLVLKEYGPASGCMSVVGM
jgi:hypothetical protein